MQLFDALFEFLSDPSVAIAALSQRMRSLLDYMRMDPEYMLSSKDLTHSNALIVLSCLAHLSFLGL